MPTIFNSEVLSEALLNKVKPQAFKGVSEGEGCTYSLSCRWMIMKYDCTIMFTRDVGRDEGETVHFLTLCIGYKGERNLEAEKEIVSVLFDGHTDKVLYDFPEQEESPVKFWSYIVICDEKWNIYPLEKQTLHNFKQDGWKSYSDVNG